MFKKIFNCFLLIILSSFLTGCSLFPQQAGLDVITTPPSKVFIDSEEIGTSPIKTTRKAGQVTLRLVPETGDPYEFPLKLTSGFETVVRREFGQPQAQSAGEIYQMEKAIPGKAILALTSTPDAVTVKINTETFGLTPLQLDQLPEGEHQLIFTSPGFKDRTIKVKTVSDYRLLVHIQLPQDTFSAPTLLPTPSVSLTPQATPSARTSLSPTPKLPTKPYVEISSSAVGYVNVRATASTGGQILGRIDHGETAPYLETSDDGEWYKVTFEESSGWISTQYAKLFEK